MAHAHGHGHAHAHALAQGYATAEEDEHDAVRLQPFVDEDEDDEEEGTRGGGGGAAGRVGSNGHALTRAHTDGAPSPHVSLQQLQSPSADSPDLSPGSATSAPLMLLPVPTPLKRKQAANRSPPPKQLPKKRKVDV